MARTKKLPKTITFDDPTLQAVYDSLTEAQKTNLGLLPNRDQMIGVMMQYASDNANVQTSAAGESTDTTQPATTSDRPKLSSSTSASQVDITDTYFQKALGVSGGRRVSQATGAPVQGTYTGFLAGTVTPYGTLQRTPKYFDGDEDLIARLTPEQIATVQAQMKKAGKLSSNYRVGIVDPQTKAAFKDVLEQANNSGADWRSALAQLEANKETGTGSLPPKVSNPDDLKRIIQQSSQYILGRDLDEQSASDLVRTYQQMQVKAQTTGITRGGMRTDLPDVQTFAQKRIQNQMGGEADAYKFARFADAIFGGD